MSEHVTGRVVNGCSIEIPRKVVERFEKLGKGFPVFLSPLMGNCMEPEIHGGEYGLVAEGMQPGPRDIAFFWELNGDGTRAHDMMSVARLRFVDVAGDQREYWGGRQVFICRNKADHVTVAPASRVEVVGTMVWHGYISPANGGAPHGQA